MLAAGASVSEWLFRDSPNADPTGAVGKHLAAMAAGGTMHDARLGRALSNLKRRREAEPGELHVNLDEALRAAKENLEALQGTGRAEEMKLEELDGLGVCAVAVLQLVESGKDSVKKRQQASLVQERQARAAKEAASNAELRRLEKEIAQLKESLASEHQAWKDKNDEVRDFQYWVMDLSGDLEYAQKELSDREHEVTNAVGQVNDLQSQLEYKTEEVNELVANREMLREELEAEKEKGKCQICFARARNTVILPCSHFQYCNRCLQQHRQRATTCPTCRVHITGTMDLYVS